jgi:hypothetical protein
LLANNPNPTEDEIAEYPATCALHRTNNIVKAIQYASAKIGVLTASTNLNLYD